MTRRARKSLIATLIFAILTVIVFASLRQRGDGDGVEVEVEAIARRSISRVVTASGGIDPRIKVNLSSHTVGKIEKLYVEEGDLVDAGQAFLELEKKATVAIRDDWRARLAKARTDVRQAEIDQADTELKLRRYARLTEEGIVSTEKLEEAELARASALLRRDQAEESVRQTRANLSKAEDDLEKTTIYSPLAGRVISLSAEEGEVVVSGTMNNPASVIATVADLSELLAVVNVDETEIVYVAPGQRAALEVDAVSERSFSGSVVEVGSSGFSRPQQPDVTFFKVKILLDEPDPDLLPGMSVRAKITTETHEDALVVPIQALVQRPPLPDQAEREEQPAEEDKGSKAAEDQNEEVPVIYLAEAGKAVRRNVATGISDTTHVEITEVAGIGAKGLAPDLEVVIGPYRTLRDLEEGDEITVESESDEAG